MDRRHTDGSDSVTNQTGREVQINLGEIQSPWVVAGLSGPGFRDEWTDDRWREMGANAFWQRLSREYRQGNALWERGASLMWPSGEASPTASEMK